MSAQVACVVYKSGGEACAGAGTRCSFGCKAGRCAAAISPTGEQRLPGGDEQPDLACGNMQCLSSKSKRCEASRLEGHVQGSPAAWSAGSAAST